VSAPQGGLRGQRKQDDEEAVAVVGQQVWYVDQIEPVGTVREPIPPRGGRVVGFVIEDPKSPTGEPILRRVQANRIRKYGDRYFLVPSWFARADQSSRELEKQLSAGLAPDRDQAFWKRLEQSQGPEVLGGVLRRFAPPTYAVVGQLAQASQQLSEDLARASQQFRRVQRALVANQSVMQPAEYAEFVDQARKWARTVRFVLMAVEFYSRSVPRAQIDIRNPDAPLPADPVFIPHEALLDIHTPGGEGRARERPTMPTVESGDGGFTEVFGDGEVWKEEGGDEFVPEPPEAGGFAAVQPLDEYEDSFVPVEEEATDSFEPVEEAIPDTEAFETVEEEATAEFEAVEEPAPAPTPKFAAVPPKRVAPPTVAPPPAKVTPTSASTPVAETLPDEDEAPTFRKSTGTEKRAGSWLTPPPPPAPQASSARMAERQEKLKDQPDLESIIAASLGKGPRKSQSKGSSAEIGGSQENAGPRTDTSALSRDLASLLEKSKKRP
jgi:hypothetical protein